MPRSESSAGGAKDGDASEEELVTGGGDGWRSAAAQVEGPGRLPDGGAGDPGARASYVAKFDPVRRIWHLARDDDGAAGGAPAPAEPKDGGDGGGESKGGAAAAAVGAPDRRPIDDAHAGPAARHRDTRWNVLRRDYSDDASDGDADSDRDAIRAPDYLLGENGDAAEPKRGRRRGGDGAKGGDGGAKGGGGGGAKGGGGGYAGLSAAELSAVLALAGLETTGGQPELLARLQQAVQGPPTDLGALRARIRTMEGRVAALESGAPAAPPAAANTAAAPAPAPAAAAAEDEEGITAAELSEWLANAAPKLKGKPTDAQKAEIAVKTGAQKALLKKIAKRLGSTEKKIKKEIEKKAKEAAKPKE